MELLGLMDSRGSFVWERFRGDYDRQPEQAALPNTVRLAFCVSTSKRLEAASTVEVASSRFESFGLK